MDVNLDFLNFEGLDDHQVSQLNDWLHPSNFSSKIEFPWSRYSCDGKTEKSGNESTLNVHAPAFEAFTNNSPPQKIDTSYSYEYSNGSPDSHLYTSPEETKEKVEIKMPVSSNGVKPFSDNFNDFLSNSQSSKPVNGENHNTSVTPPISSFKLNPTVSCFVPQSIRTFVQPSQDNGTTLPETISYSGLSSAKQQHNTELEEDFTMTGSQNGEALAHEPSDNLELLNESVKDTTQNVDTFHMQNVNVVAPSTTSPISSTNSASSNIDSPVVDVTASKPVRRSWAQIVSSGQQSSDKVPPIKSHIENKAKVDDIDSLCIDEDKMALSLGKHLFELKLDFELLNLQPRGLINRRNWCYINATLQALLASSPFYTMIRNLPLGPGVERGKSATPVIDSMVKVTYEFSQFEASQEELQVGQPFQPDFIYDMLRDLKSDCLKGQQEDAEEFLSFILNGMHEEMGKIIKNYKEKNCIGLVDKEVKENGDLSDGEEEWQVIGSKHKGMVTRKVVEHNSPISELLGGQIKSFLTTSGSKTSASIQPFFTLQLDIQSETVTSVSEALKEMTIKEPIQGYTCAKTKQEVEAYSHISLQKLPPVLILHLKRFVYNKTGGCKKVMKKTDYPLELELSRDLFSPDVKKSQRMRMYKLFAVMYHDGEEAVKGHYISDVYNHGCKTWIRCDDRQVTAVTEEQVLSHTPPRVPYLLFYQECSL